MKKNETCTEEILVQGKTVACPKIAVGDKYGPMGSFPKCAEHMPAAMTPEEREVIEAATLAVEEFGLGLGQRLVRAVKALAKPPPPTLVERLRADVKSYEDGGSVETKRLLLEAADALERLGAK